MLQPGIVEAADRALVALKKMRAGMRADRVIQNKRKIKGEVSTLFTHKKKLKLCKSVPWKHKFYCPAYVRQDRVPTTDTDKDELFQAGLGEKDIEFDSLDNYSGRVQRAHLCQLSTTAGRWWVSTPKMPSKQSYFGGALTGCSCISQPTQAMSGKI